MVNNDEILMYRNWSATAPEPEIFQFNNAHDCKLFYDSVSYAVCRMSPAFTTNVS